MGNMNQKMISLVTINAHLQVKKGNSDRIFTKAIPILSDHIFIIDILPFLPHPLNTRFHMARISLLESPADPKYTALKSEIKRSERRSRGKQRV
jgi:hypothetical protein